MATASSSDYRKTLDWLQKLLGENVPSWEITDENVKILTQLRQINMKQEESAKEYVTELKDLVREKDDENARLSRFLEALDLSLFDLDAEAKEKFEDLVETICNSGLDSIDPSILVERYCKIEFDRLGAKENKLREQKIMAAVQKLLEDVEQSLQDLKLQETSLKAKKISLEDKEMTLRSKLKSVERKHKEYKARLDGKGEIVPEELKHHKIVEEAKQIQKLESNVKKLRAALEAYHGLPPNLKQAQLQIKEAEKELKYWQGKQEHH